MIKIELIGNIGKDAEQITIGGTNYASFSVAVTEKVKNEDRTTWYRAMKFDKDGKLSPHLTKGKKVYLCGRPTISAYVSKKDNSPIADLTVWVSELVFCGGGGEKQQTEPQQEQQPDDLPF